MSTLRADAQRNHDRVLVAAAEAFAEHGPDVSADEIARRAGVGHGTVYRRFPSKDALIAAVVSARLSELSDRAEELLAEPDAGRSVPSVSSGTSPSSTRAIGASAKAFRAAARSPRWRLQRSACTP